MAHFIRFPIVGIFKICKKKLKQFFLNSMILDPGFRSCINPSGAMHQIPYSQNQQLLIQAQNPQKKQLQKKSPKVASRKLESTKIASADFVPNVRIPKENFPKMLAPIRSFLAHFKIRSQV